MTTKSLKAYKTPLRYPGGKSRACTKMDQYFPDLSGYVEFREPFLGGGSVAGSGALSSKTSPAKRKELKKGTLHGDSSFTVQITRGDVPYSRHYQNTQC